MNKISNIINYTVNFLNSVKAGIACRIKGFNPNTKEYWNKKLSRLNGNWRTSHYELILDLLPKGKDFKLLDVGCAFGDGCELIKEEYPDAEITGIDFSEVGIESAKEKGSNIEYKTVDVLKDSIPGTFDHITIIQTLEHFDDPFFVVEKCLEHTKNSLIISTPYDQNTSFTFGEHRFSFDENTFDRFNSRVAKVTNYSPQLGYKCIVYEIRP